MKKALIPIAMAATAVLAVNGAAWAQDYPKNGKTINILVPFPPGGASDALARLVGQKLSDAWGTPVVVQNKPGGDMLIGLQAVAKSEKDGYTIGLTTSSFALNKVVKKDFPMDPVGDFAFIGLMGQSPYVLAVNADSRHKTFKELEAATQDKSGKFSYASCCLGTYFAAEMIKNATRLDGLYVPYKGSAPAMTSILSKEVDYVIDTTTSNKPFIASGKLRPLMVTSRQRTAAFPDVPNMTEAGVPGDFDIGVWYGLAFPAGTPADIVKKANATLNKILAQPDVKEKIESFAIDVTPSTPEQMTERAAKDLRSFIATARDAKLKFDN